MANSRKEKREEKSLKNKFKKLFEPKKREIIYYTEEEIQERKKLEQEKEEQEKNEKEVLEEEEKERNEKISEEEKKFEPIIQKLAKITFEQQQDENSMMTYRNHRINKSQELAKENEQLMKTHIEEAEAKQYMSLTGDTSEMEEAKKEEKKARLRRKIAKLYKLETILLQSENELPPELNYSSGEYYATFEQLAPEKKKEIFQQGFKEAVNFYNTDEYKKEYKSGLDVLATDISKYHFMLTKTEDKIEQEFWSNRIFDLVRHHEKSLSGLQIKNYQERNYGNANYFASGSQFEKETLSDKSKVYHTEAIKEAKNFAEDFIAFAKDYSKLRKEYVTVKQEKEVEKEM